MQLNKVLTVGQVKKEKRMNDKANDQKVDQERVCLGKVTIEV